MTAVGKALSASGVNRENIWLLQKVASSQYLYLSDDLSNPTPYPTPPLRRQGREERAHSLHNNSHTYTYSLLTISCAISLTHTQRTHALLLYLLSFYIETIYIPPNSISGGKRECYGLWWHPGWIQDHPDQQPSIICRYGAYPLADRHANPPLRYSSPSPYSQEVCSYISFA